MVYRILLLFFIGVSSLHAQEPTASSFNGKVKSVTEHSYKAKKRRGEIVKGRPAHEYSWQSDFAIRYDSTGLVDSRALYSKSGECTSVTIFYYDKHRLMTRQYIVGDSKKSPINFDYINEYDDSNKVKKRTVRRRIGDPLIVYFYSHDSRGNIYETKQVSEGFPMKTVDTRQFDSVWHVTKEWFYSKTGSLISRHEYTYNYRGEMTSEIVYDPSNKIIVQYNWIYGENDDLITYEVCTSSLFNCEAWTYKYEYDKSGNWVKRIDYRNGKPVFIKERQFIYH